MWAALGRVTPPESLEQAMTEVSGGTGERFERAGDREIAERLEAIEDELATEPDRMAMAALVAERATILASIDDMAAIARLFTRTLVPYSSRPGYDGPDLHNKNPQN
jgi:hypothetical protein